MSNFVRKKQLIGHVQDHGSSLVLDHLRYLSLTARVDLCISGDGVHFPRPIKYHNSLRYNGLSMAADLWSRRGVLLTCQ